MNENCGCCDGIQQLTPITIANRPGLNALSYRVGTHGSFLETMLARLSNLPVTIQLNEIDADGKQKTQTLYPLRELTTRALSDPAIAFLDAWATVADVLTFYQERIANEGYLRTATERRSILELAHLVGYTLRPGVAASVFLAYTLEKNHNVTIPIGNRAQSVPGPGELPQSFETSEVLEARADWNALKARLTRPQFITLTPTTNGSLPPLSINDPNTVYLEGTATKLKQGDALLFIASTDKGEQAFSHVSTLDVDTTSKRTKVVLQGGSASSAATAHAVRIMTHGDRPSLFSSLVAPLSRPLIAQPPNSQKLERSVSQAFSTQSDIHPQLLINFSPILQPTLYSALANVQLATSPLKQAVQVMSVKSLRVKAALFGHNLPLTPDPETILIAEAASAEGSIDSKLIALDAEYKEITRDSWVVVERRDNSLNEPIFTISQIDDVQTMTLGGFQQGALGIFSTQGATTSTQTNTRVFSNSNPPSVISTSSSTSTSVSVDPVRVKVTVLKLKNTWLQDTELEGLKKHDPRQALLGNTTVYIQSEELLMAEEPLDDEISDEVIDANKQIKKVGASTIELDKLYDGIHSGQRLIISGERTDVSQVDGSGKPIPGVSVSELIMLASVTQEVAQIKNDSFDKSIPLPGDKKHTFLHLAKPLAYTYKRDTVTISANVVRATHGETRSEVLGSGDGSKALQRFTLKQSPLTYLAAATPAGAQSTLEVRVNNIRWHEAGSLPELHPKNHGYILETDDADKTSVIFGNGIFGARLPTGVENVKAVYRTGIGKPGNVKAGQISLLATKPLYVKSVINPLRASGGADRENRDQARRNVPLAVMALDRLVSVQDYADFSRTYAGIGKASAVQLRTSSGGQVVHVTIAGAENIPIDTTSDLYINLFQALLQFGDPHLPLRVDIAEVLFLVISVKIRLLPDYKLEFVAPNVRTALLDAFSFDRRELGQPIFQSEVLSVIQGVSGVDYADLLVMGALDQDKVLKAFDDVQSTTEPDQEENGEAEDEDPMSEEEKQEEFLEELGLTTHQDVLVNLAQVNPNLPKITNPKPSDFFLPAQLVFLTPDIPDTLIITELPL
jgi:hypothetical protein